MSFVLFGPDSVFVSGLALPSMCLYGQDVHAVIMHTRSQNNVARRKNLSDLLALGGMLFVGDVEQGAVCVVFAFAKAGSGVPVTTLSAGVASVGGVFELVDITGNDPSTSVGGFCSGAGTTSSSPALGTWRTSSTPLLPAARL